MRPSRVFISTGQSTRAADTVPTSSTTKLSIPAFTGIRKVLESTTILVRKLRKVNSFLAVDPSNALVDVML
jgi:hypothetical protein